MDIKEVNRLIYRSEQSLGVPGQSEHECGKVVSPTHRPFYAPGNIPGTHFWTIVRLQE